MPLYRAMLVTLSAGERKMLKKRARGAKTAYRDWLRAQIVLAAARGQANARIAADLHVTVDTVRKWRGRFAARGLDGLTDLPRCGRPRRISALDRAAVVALACQLPAATGVPLARWSGPELAAELVTQGLVNAISASSVLRILAAVAVIAMHSACRIELTFPRDRRYCCPARACPGAGVGVASGGDGGARCATCRLLALSASSLMLQAARNGGPIVLPPVRGLEG